MTVTPATPTIATTPEPATAQIGSSVADQATIAGGFNPTGTVTFKLYDNSTATGTALFTDTENLANGMATSKGYVATSGGTFYWDTTYNGDTNNNSVSAVPQEQVTISATPTITTTQESGGVVDVTDIADEASVTGGDNPTGTVTFDLYDNSSATGTPLFMDTEPLTGGIALSRNYTPNTAGTFYWVATYNGDTNNSPVTSTDNGEPVTITPASPGITSPQQAPVTVGNEISDSAEINSGYIPTGTVTFNPGFPGWHWTPRIMNCLLTA